MNAVPGRTAGVLAMAVMLASGCGEDKSERAQVRGYLVTVNELQKGWGKRLQTANDSYISFSRGELSPQEAATELEQAARDIREVREKVGAIRAPAPARPLHAKIVRVYDLNVDFADQTALLADYQRRVGEILDPVTRYDRELNRGLSRRRSPAGQARALAVFARRLGRTLTELRAVEVPRILRVTHGDQVRRLDGARRLAVRLRSALRAQDAKRIARLLVRFRAGSRTRKPRSDLAREAIRAYGRRYEQMAGAYREVREEQERLDRALG